MRFRSSWRLSDGQSSRVFPFCSFSSFSSVILFAALAVSSAATSAAVVDCSNAQINQIIDSSASSILYIQTSSCGELHVCLDATGTNMTQSQSNRLYAHALAKHIAGQTLVRLSYDNAKIVAGCGYPLVVEIR